MKRLLLFFVVFLLVASGGFAQNTVVTIGSSPTFSNITGPICMSSSSPTTISSRHIGLYTAAEIRATSFNGNVLTKLAWFKNTTAGYTATGGYFRIYLKQTTATALGNMLGVSWTNELTTATLVYDEASPVISTGIGWKEVTLQTPLIWDGTSNLEVMVEWNAPGTITSSIDWAYTAITGNVSAATLGIFPSNMSATGNRPDIQLTFTTFNNDASLTAVTSPALKISPGIPTPVKVDIKNAGFNAITSATIGWKLNNVAQPDFNFVGNVASGSSQAGVTIATQSFPVGAHKIVAYPKTVNGQPDGFRNNDTIVYEFASCNTLSGAYTINKNLPVSATNFPSFTAAASLLNSCGISGPVTFTVAPNSGPYNETLELTNISGTSATNTITFEGSGDTLRSGDPAVVKLDRANYVKINNLKIISTSTASTTFGVQLYGPSNFATISNSTVSMLPTNTGSNVIGILIGQTSNGAGNFASNCVFENNIVQNGYYSMRFNGQSVTGSNPIGSANNRVINNQFRDFYFHCLYLTEADGTIISQNDISRPTRATVSSFNGITINTGSVNTVVSKNRIHNAFGAATNPNSVLNGIVVSAAAGVGNENIIANNLFYELNNTSSITVLSLGSATGLRVFYNTIVMDDQTRPTSNTSNIRGIYLSGAGVNVQLKNNLITLNMPGTGTKAAIYLNAATGTDFITDYNAFYLAPTLTNAFIGFRTSGKATLADWQATITPAYDVNSVVGNPAFVNAATGNFTPTSSSLNNTATPVTLVTDDFTGLARHLTTPDPGAYEYSLGTTDAGVTAFNSPVTPVLPGVSTPVSVTLKNFGTANLTSATIGWKVNGVMQPDFSWTGNLNPNADAAVTIGNYTFSAGSYTVCAWSKLPNGLTDANLANDSTCTALNACAPMAGTFTINKNNPTSATNFQSFNDAAARLHTCGISGRVTINVVGGSGPYNEQVALLNIPGAGGNNRVIFRGNGNILTATPTPQKTYILKLDDADYVRIDNLAINLTGIGAAGNPTYSAIQLVNASDNDTISNCTITMPHTLGTNIYIMGILAGIDVTLAGNNTNNSVFMNNTINGGLCGIRLNGNANGTNSVNNRIIGNTLSDAYGFGIVLDNTDGALVERNEIKRPTHVNPGTVQGISLLGSAKNNRITKNYLHTLWGGVTSSIGTTYSLYLSGAGAPAGSPNQVDNNLINNNGNPRTTYGIYVNGSANANFYHNTIYSSTTDSFYGFYQLGATATNLKFNNNIIALAASGSTGAKYGIYLATPIETNNNVIYLGSAAANANIGHLAGTDYATLAAWKTANGGTFDQQSVSDNPIFVTLGTTILVPSSQFVNNIGKPLPAVTTDYLNAPRNAATPDPGVYEFVPVSDDTGVIAFVAPASGCGLTNQATVTVTIKNMASTTQTSIPVSFQVDGGTPVVETYTGNLAFNATVNYTFTAKANLSAIGPHTILARTNLPNDGRAFNDTLTLKLVNGLQASIPTLLDLETAATGMNILRVVTRSNAVVTESANASFGTGSTKGLLMEGIDNATWAIPTGINDPWASNPDNFSAAYFCVATAGGSASDSLWLTLDLKQLFKATNANTNFRVTVNGVQVGPTHRPPFDPNVNPIVWKHLKFDLTPYKNLPVIQVGLESSVKEGYDFGNGTANLIDNIRVQRRMVSGIKNQLSESQVRVFPNPSAGRFTVQLPAGKCNLEVTDLSGRQVNTTTGVTNLANLDLTGLAKGIYLLKVTNPEGTAINKIVIE